MQLYYLMFSEIARDGAFAAHFTDEDIALARSRDLLQVKEGRLKPNLIFIVPN